MGKEDTKDLRKFLEPFDNYIKEIALWLREYVWDLYPNCNELIYDNYNAVAFGWSPTDRVNDTFCSVAVFGNKYVHFGFYWGSQLSDPKKILLGNGKQYRYIKVIKKSDFPQVYIKKLMREAYVYSVSKPKNKKCEIKGTTIVKSISEAKRRPGIMPVRKK